MAKKIGTALTVVGIAAVTVATAGAGAALVGAGFLGPGLASGLVLAGSLASQIGRGLLASPPPDPSARPGSASNLRTGVQPFAAARWVFGRTTLPLQIVYAQLHDDDQRALQVLAGAMHPISDFRELTVKDTDLTIGASGATATGPSGWAGVVARSYRAGPSNAALETTGVWAGHTFPSQATGEGLGWMALTWDLTHPELRTQIPTRITQVVDGCPVYDPRQDSTVGGSGSHRADDRSTWTFDAAGDEEGRNAVLIALTYMLGWTIPLPPQLPESPPAWGMHKDPEDFDMASWIAAANAADVTVDGVPRGQIGGSIALDGNHERVIAELEAATGMHIALSQGRYVVWYPQDDLASPAWTLDEADVLRDAGVQYRDSRPMAEIVNTARGEYVDPAELYLPVAYPDVVEDTAVSDDGRERAIDLDLPLVQDQGTAERRARQHIRRSRLGRAWTLAVGPEFIAAQPFDVVSLTLRETNDTAQLARITAKSVLLTGAIVLTLEEEDAAIYDPTIPLGTPVTQDTVPEESTSVIYVERGLPILVTPDGRLQPNVRHGTGFPVLRHREQGQDEDGASNVIFTQQYDALPRGQIFPGDGAKVVDGVATGDQHMRMKLVGLSVVGFDELMGELIQPASTSSQVDGWSTAQNAAAPENGDVVLDSDGAEAFSNLEDANAAPVDYTVRFDVDTSDLSGQAIVEVQIYANDGATSTNWTLVASETFADFQSETDASLTFTAALGANYDLRAVASVILDSGGDPTAEVFTVTMHGEDHAEPGVQWERDDGTVIIDTMSPSSTNSRLNWSVDDVA